MQERLKLISIPAILIFFVSLFVTVLGDLTSITVNIIKTATAPTYTVIF